MGLRDYLPWDRDIEETYLIHENNAVWDDDGGLCCPGCGIAYDSNSVIIRPGHVGRVWECMNCGHTGRIQKGIPLLRAVPEDDS